LTFVYTSAIELHVVWFRLYFFSPYNEFALSCD